MEKKKKKLLAVNMFFGQHRATIQLADAILLFIYGNNSQVVYAWSNNKCNLQVERKLMVPTN